VKSEFDVVVLGGGAAGLMCALEAGRRGRRVLVLERAARVGKKILISGGGRCNFTNRFCGAANFISGNGDFCKSALARFTPEDFIRLVEKHGIAWHEKRPYEGAAPGQLFCDRSAEDVVRLLVEECAAVGVRILVGVDVREVRREVGGGFVVRVRGNVGGEQENGLNTQGTESPGSRESAENSGVGGISRAQRSPVAGEQAKTPSEDVEDTEKENKGAAERRVEGRQPENRNPRRDGPRFEAQRRVQLTARTLVVATGGLSIPKMGATGFGYEVARQFGHSIVETRPGLVPLTFGRKEAREWGHLAGVSAMVEVFCGDRVGASSAKGRLTGQAAPKFREKMLFTHRGLSGPAILQASSYWALGESVRVDLAPGLEWTGVFVNGERSGDSGRRRDVAAARTALRRLLPARLADAWIAGHALKDWTNAGLAAAEAELHAWEVCPVGTEGYEKAEVTVGGVNTEELSSKTMESRLVPGLYFIGEVVDVTGWLGGFNFQWAWASGAAAGRAV